MPQIYQNPQGESVYDVNGTTFSAKTGQVVSTPTSIQSPMPTQNQPKLEPVVISSEQGLTDTFKNQDQLQKTQAGIQEAQKQAANIQQGIQNYITLHGVSSSPVSSNMIGQVNQASAEGLTDAEQLAALKKKETDAMSSIQLAQSAIDKGDVVGLDVYVKQFNEQKAKYEKDLADYMTNVNQLRSERMRLATPGLREQEISRQLKDLRIEQERFNLQTEKDKMSEFEGQTLGFAGGRASEIDIKASFRRKETALSEQNLLLELGLQQQAREYQGKAVEQQLSDFASDFQLHQQVEEKLNVMENDILEKASKLEADSRTILGTFMKDLEGMAFEDLSAQAQAKVTDLARQGNIPISLLQDALKAQKARVDFDNALKAGAAADKEKLQFISGTKEQQSGVFNPKTGTFTPFSGIRTGGGGGAVTQFSDVINSASNLVGSERGKTSKAAMTEAINSGDYVSAYAQIANNVEESITGEAKTRFSSARTDYTVLLGLKSAIQEYADSGGNMGLLTGKEEEIKRKLGIDSGKATVIATQLWREFQTYRLNMTGAAFSPAESKDYASVNPTLGKSLSLNLSVIDGALAQLENRVTSTINTRIPNAKNLYTKVQQVNPADGLSDDDAYAEYLKLINK